MPGPFAPADTLVGPIAHEIATLIQTQIPSINTVYEKLPDRPPGDNCVILPLTVGKVEDDTNGKLKVMLTFSMRHLFRRTNMSDSITQAYAYVQPWLNFLSAWSNQSLGGLAIEVNATKLTIAHLAESGQPMVGLVVDFNVLTEFNIPLS
jgi:hypothetical protein